MTERCVFFLIGWFLGVIVGRCAKWLHRDLKEKQDEE